MTAPAAFNSGAPARIGSGSETVTLMEGATFCLSDRHGNMRVGRSHGLFFRDARVLSRWELRIDGRAAESLSVAFTEAFAARSSCAAPQARAASIARCLWSGSG